MLAVRSVTLETTAGVGPPNPIALAGETLGVVGAEGFSTEVTGVAETEDPTAGTVKDVRELVSALLA